MEYRRFFQLMIQYSLTLENQVFHQSILYQCFKKKDKFFQLEALLSKLKFLQVDSSFQDFEGIRCLHLQQHQYHRVILLVHRKLQVQRVLLTSIVSAGFKSEELKIVISISFLLIIIN